MEGKTLKGWRVGKKLGSGACSDVYAVEPTDSKSRGDRRYVMKVSPVPAVPATKAKKKRKKTPAERNADALYAEHLLYQSHLRDHPGLPVLPATGAYGEDQGFRFLVMERLGRTLGDVVIEHGAIPSPTAARLGLEILETLKHIHSKNIVYVDVKPENFMLDAAKENKIYCVDFGISERYVMATGKHKDYRVGAVVGTPTFMSLNCHNGATASRRDDLEALLNVLIYAIRGNLPWEKANSDQEGAKIKKDTPVQTLCRSLPKEWAELLTKIRACGFDEKPDYDYFTQRLEKLGGTLGSSAPFDWGSAGKQATDGTTTAASPAKSLAKSPTKKRARAGDGAKVSKAPAAAAADKTRNGKKAAISKAKKDEDDDDDVEFVGEVAADPHRRRKAAAKAVMGAAAAKAAANQASNPTGRYSLRSSQ